MESFFSNFECVFELLAKTGNIQMNSEAWILIKVQFIIYQWISLVQLYKLMENFFQISELFFKLTKYF